MAEQKPIISIDHVSMRFNLSKEKHESLKEYFVALLHGGVRFDEFFALDDVLGASRCFPTARAPLRASSRHS